MKVKKRFGIRYLPNYIGNDPLPYKINVKDLEDGPFFDMVNDNFLIFDISTKSAIFWIGILFIITNVLALFLGIFNGRTIEFGKYLWFFLGSSLFILYSYKGPEQKVVFDRLNGIVSFPNSFFPWHTITLPYKDMLVTISAKYKRGPALSFIHPNGWTSTNIVSYECLEIWWLIVWYMDKNRPLPYGTAFDAYREKDFKRRKKEKFPYPLANSLVSTQEASQKQQKERQRIGGW